MNESTPISEITPSQGDCGFFGVDFKLLNNQK